jgi:hypothetical protein
LTEKKKTKTAKSKGAEDLSIDEVQDRLDEIQTTLSTYGKFGEETSEEHGLYN